MYCTQIGYQKRDKLNERLNLKKKKTLQALCFSLPSMTPSLVDCKAKICEDVTEKEKPILCTFCMDNLSE